MSSVLRRALLAAIAWGAFAFGAVYDWAAWPLFAACGGVGAVMIVRTRAWTDPRALELAAALGLVAVAIALQTVPLPTSWILHLSPGVTDLLSRSYVGYTPSATRALSIAPADTLLVIVRYVSLAVFLIGLSRGIRGVGPRWTAGRLAVLGSILAVVAIVQRASIDPDRPLVYGFWRPHDGGNPFGPFINRNHYAGWMVMALPIVFGYAGALVAAESGRRRVTGGLWQSWFATVPGNRALVAGFAALVMGMSLVLSGSRSGMAGFALGLAVAACVVIARLESRLAKAAVIVGPTVLLLGAILWAGAGRAADRFVPISHDVASRAQAWRDTAAIAQHFPLAGTGLGTYRLAMLVYQTGDRSLLYAQAHNDYLQLAAEGGWLVGVPLLILAGVGCRIILRRVRSGQDDEETAWLRAGAIGGLAGIAAQSLVDFSLQVPGNAVLFVVTLALALHRPSRSTPHAHRV